MFKRIADLLTAFFLLIIAAGILFGGLYLSVRQSGQWPQWTGQVLATFSGGILALVSAFFATALNRKFSKEQLEHNNRTQATKVYKDYLLRLYALLSRKVVSREFRPSMVAAKIDVKAQEVDQIACDIPPLGTMCAVFSDNVELQNQIQNTIITGLKLLYIKDLNIKYPNKLSAWVLHCQEILDEIRKYENTPLA